MKYGSDKVSPSVFSSQDSGTVWAKLTLADDGVGVKQIYVRIILMMSQPGNSRSVMAVHVSEEPKMQYNNYSSWIDLNLF